MAELNLAVIRTLNYLRGIHLPTYVALRLMLKRVPVESLDLFVEQVINQVTLRKSPRVLNLKRFKAVVDGNFVYRNYSVPSPTSALADSRAISIIHSSGVVYRRRYVYSYRRPMDENYPKSFEHFSVGYRERNDEIATALDDPTMSAVIVDIRSFYPSVDARKTLEILRGRLNMASDISSRDRAVVLASAERASVPLKAGQPMGLRVGPEMSHVLADISLEEMDSTFFQMFGERYFRYVDDIVVVVPRREVATARSAIGKVIKQAGHTISEEKDSVVSAEDWFGYREISRGLESDSSSALNKFKFRAKLYMAKRPPDVEGLREALRIAGVFLPIDQLLDASRQKAWRYRVSSLFSRRWKVVASYWSDSLADVVTAARECKQHVIYEVDRALDSGVSSAASSVARKWQIQSARIAMNRALYFADESTLRRIERYASEVPELAETSAVCLALLGDASRVMQMPGPAIAAFSQVASIRRLGFPALGGLLGSGDSGVLADISAHFALRGGSEDFGPAGLDSDFAGLTAFARGSSDIWDLARVGGYGAEVASLAINSSRHERIDAAATRFALEEDVVLDALSLSANYVS